MVSPFLSLLDYLCDKTKGWKIYLQHPVPGIENIDDLRAALADLEDRGWIENVQEFLEAKFHFDLTDLGVSIARTTSD